MAKRWYSTAEEQYRGEDVSEKPRLQARIDALVARGPDPAAAKNAVLGPAGPGNFLRIHFDAGEL